MLQFGDYKERVWSQDQITRSSYSYQNIKRAYHFYKDPEVRPRLKEAAWVKWSEETLKKYLTYGHVNDKLQKQDFLIDIKRRYE
jgi:hypothetical protein